MTELLVVIAIIGILVSFLMSAVQRARESANRIQCENQLKQIGLAMHSYYDVWKVFPSNGGWDGTQTILSVNGTPFTPDTFDFTTNQNYQFGVGVPGLSPQDQTGSWAYSILPYLEQSNLYQQCYYPATVPDYVCPSRRQNEPKLVCAQDAYGLYTSGGWAWARIDYGMNLVAFGDRPVCKRIADITDGLSNTIFVGEKAYDSRAQAGSWYYDEPFFLGGSNGTGRGGTTLCKDAFGIDFRDNWGSAHPVGLNFLYGDGSVHHVVYFTPRAIIQSMLTANGGETVDVPD